MRYISLIILMLSAFFTTNGQTIIIDGYTYETGNRGFIANAKIAIMDGEEVLKTTIADKEGHFVASVSSKEKYTLHLTSELHEDLKMQVNTTDKTDDNKIFVKAAMRRLPGYLLDLTMAESRSSEDSIVDAITDARIDLFNNSTFEEVLVEEHYADPNFSLPLFKGNHYTILIRKEGYIAKRIEAFVDVEGCILCFEGLGSVRPGVTENLSRNNQIGVLLANVSLERAFSGKTIVLKDLYYDFGKAFLRPGAKKELNKLTRMMKDNPEIKVELGAHTDSRGDAEKNKKLSKRRAENAVKYLTAKGIDPERIISFGYGESQLRNECKDGVSCSEEKHSYNRRTELKFLDIVKSSEPVKSLKQMKMFDKAEKEMEELAFGGQVKIEEKDSDKKADKDAVDDKLGSKDKIDTPLATGKIKDIIYKVLIRESATALPLDDDLFKTHVDLVEVKTETGYKYLIGTYLEMDQIKEYYNNTVKVAYPESTIVKYGNGQIIE